MVRRTQRHVTLPLQPILLLATFLALEGICALAAESLGSARTSQAAVAPEEAAVDLALFARVITSPPTRHNGTRAGRLDEFPAEDVFLTREVPVNPDGTYSVPISDNGVGSIGLEWAERRVLTSLAIEFTAVSEGLSPSDSQVQYWSSEGRKDSWSEIGQTPWQGRWDRLPGSIEAAGTRWTFRINTAETPELRDGFGTLRVRWLLGRDAGRTAVRKLSARGSSRWTTVDLRAEADPSLAGQTARLTAYNGLLLDDKGDGVPLAIAWPMAGVRSLRVRHNVPVPSKLDRTLIRLELPAGCFSVAVEDVLATEGVYVKDFGVFVSRLKDGLTLEAYRRKHAGDKTILQRVREMPDQTFDGAMAALWRPIQNNGPTMLSLAADNRKFIVQRSGEILFKTSEDRLRIVPRFGESQVQIGQGSAGVATTPSSSLPGRNAQLQKTLTRHLDGPWLPIPVHELDDAGVKYRQRTCVVSLDEPDRQIAFACEKPLFAAEFEVHNTTDQARRVDLAIGVTGIKGDSPLKPDHVGGRVLFVAGEQLLAWVEAVQGPLAMTTAPGVLSISGDLPAGAHCHLVLFVPGWGTAPGTTAEIAKSILPTGGSKPGALADGLRGRVEEYWTRMLAGAMQVNTPEPLLNDFIRSTQVRCLIAARSENDGALIAPWIAANTYGPLDTEAQAVILGMDLMGHHEFARRSHDFFISSYNPDGMLAKGYTLMGTGQHLWTLAEHVALTDDRDWANRIAPQIVRPCDWILRQLDKTKQNDSRGEKLPEWGLMPPGVLADWNRYAYYFYANAHLCAGIRGVAESLGRIQHPRAAGLATAAAEYRDSILRAWQWNQSRMPVVPLRDGTWVPPFPSSLYCYGPTRDFYQGVSSIGHDTEVGGNHLVPLGLIEPRGRDAGWIADVLEDRLFLIDGIFKAYPAVENERDWFNRGGFAKLQPHYARTADLHALHDEVKPFIRTYFNTFPVLLNKENLTYWEHMNNGGAWDKTHESGWFLQMTRTMMVMERGNALWLAPFVTGNWLKDGMSVAVRNAPTHFGRVSYEIRSRAAEGTIEAMVEPPVRSKPASLILRLRHHEGRPMRRVTLNGRDWTDFDPQAETISLPPDKRRITVTADYR